MATRVREEVASSLQRAGLTAEDEVLVGLSGGVDSLSLAHALAALHASGEGPRVRALHVDHRLRPESAEEAERVVALGRALGVPVEVAVVDVARWERALGEGEESAARAARYAALARAARDRGIRSVAVGHTRDDQAETVLLRLARGAGLAGLAGMREISSRPIPLDPDGRERVEVTILRPLLEASRSEIEAYARAHGLHPVEDPSNASPRYRRNVIRRQVLPLLESAAPGAKTAIARTARLLQDDADLLDRLAEAAWDEVAREERALILIDRPGLAARPPALQRRVLLAALARLAGDRMRPTSERLEATRLAALAGEVSTRVEVGGGIEAYVDYGCLALGPAGQLEAALRERSGCPLLEPGRVVPLAGRIDLPLSDGWRLRGEAPAAQGDWVVRTRRPGDRLACPGGPTVRLQDWFVNQKVPAYVRDWLPLLAERGVVRWVGGVSHAVYRDPDAGVVVRLERRGG